MTTNGHDNANRRQFLTRAGGAFAGFAVAGGARAVDAQSGPSPAAAPARRERAFEIREAAALTQKNGQWPSQIANGDEARHGTTVCFTKALPHNRLGEVEPPAFDALLRALDSGDDADFENIPLGGAVRLADPQAAFAYTLEGADSQQFMLRPPPAFASVEQAGEMAELYWHAMLRDVPFADYATHPLAQAACDDLSRFEVYRGANGERLTPARLFRGPTRGDLLGPYVSQFLLKDVPYGTRQREQKVRTSVAGDDYLIAYTNWLAIQNGGPSGMNRSEQAPRYILNGRDVGEYVHWDFTYQAFLDAALILLGMRVPFDSRNPYRASVTQAGFGTFGGPHVLDLVARVTSAALKATWYQKWLVHRRIRPEEFGGRVHNHLTHAAAYPIHESLLKSPVLEMVAQRHRTYLLPQAYPEGAPVHPSYPAGHAAIAGACATALKACFHEATVITEAVTPAPNGLALVRYEGTDRLTVGNELDKLASNIAIARNFAGVHYRSDGVEGLKLGEAVALTVLRDMKDCYRQLFRGFSITKFDGTTIIV